VHVAEVRELGAAGALAGGDELGRQREPIIEVPRIGERGVGFRADGEPTQVLGVK
jgi:hypothetical protein